MAYIGVQPTDTYLSIASQQITGTGSATYTLDYSVSNEEDVAVFVNNVRQNVSSYTVSGTSLTLGGTISASDECWVLFLGRTVGTKTPADGSVSLDKLSATGTKSSSTFLRGDNTFATVPTGVSLVDMQVITTTSTYTPTSGTQFVKVYCVGAGGGGGGAESTATGGQVRAGGGGGGGTAIRTYNSTELGATASITIGSGGTGGAGSTFSDGADGGNTTFNPAGTGVTLTGNGGEGGYGLSYSNAISSRNGNGGTATNGQLNIRGNCFGQESDPMWQGDPSGTEGVDAILNYRGNAGGGSFLSSNGEVLFKPRAASGGTAETIVSANGDNGSGGNGGYVQLEIATADGGDGGDGMVVIEEYA